MSSKGIRLLRKLPYSGTRTGIVIGIDVGTTFSGVSYAILHPGKLPEVRPVTRFSGQAVEASKIPSIIYYDLNDNVALKAIGAAATLDTTIEHAVAEDWFKTEHFKMQLRPSGIHLETSGFKLGDLPSGKTAEQVMGDFLRYLVDETGKYISDAHSDGQKLWTEVKDEAVFVLGHPNGWTGYSQQRYRDSAVLGGLVPDTEDGRKRIKFVTEGEASALACLSGGLGPTTLDQGFRFIIVDAGGGTVDLSTFEVSKISPLELRECAAPDCRFAGSVFVDQHGLQLLQRKLRNSDYDDEQSLRSFISDEFEVKTKRVFDGETTGLVKVGGRKENDKKRGIRNGFLLLSRDELSECFTTSIRETVRSVKGQLSMSCSDGKTTPVWLVGGFGSSPYLLKGLRNALEPEGIVVQTPDTNLAKAVANGAVLHYIDGLVKARVCKTSYGTTCHIRFNPLLPDHRARFDSIQSGSDGAFIGPIFDCILEKGTTVKEGRTFYETYSKEFFSKESAAHFTVDLLCYDGDLPVPQWYKENKDKYRKVCTLEADLSALCHGTTDAMSMLDVLAHGMSKSYWRVRFDIELKFGTTEEIEAAIRWEENGETRYGPVKIDWQK